MRVRRKKKKSKPGQLIRAFDFKIDKKDYIRSMILTNDRKFLYVGFSWNNSIRVFNVPQNKEESNFFVFLVDYLILNIFLMSGSIKKK